MTARPPQIHQSALSPTEWDAYQPLLEAFSHQFGDSNLEPNKVWEWLRGRLQDESVATREKEVRRSPSATVLALRERGMDPILDSGGERGRKEGSFSFVGRHQDTIDRNQEILLQTNEMN